MSKEKKYITRVERPLRDFSMISLDLWALNYIKFGKKDLNFSPNYIFIHKGSSIKILVEKSEHIKFIKRSYDIIINNSALFEKRRKQWIIQYHKLSNFLNDLKKEKIKDRIILKTKFKKFFDIVSEIPEVVLAGYHYLSDLEQLTNGKIKINADTINKKIDQKIILKNRKATEDYWYKIEKIVKLLVYNLGIIYSMSDIRKYYFLIRLHEIKEIFIGEEQTIDFKARTKEFAFIGGRKETYEREQLKRFILKYRLFFVSNKLLKNTKELKGTPVNNGLIKGIVLVAHSFEEFRKKAIKLKNNFILVTQMTSPQHIPFFKKVSGIVTNEGGILSHATIISRELNIPCIVGTKIATKVLKDGDLVEVDAKKGIVKILKKN